MKKSVLVSAIAFTLCGCTNSTGASRALLDAGYSDIHLTGHRFLMCGQDDISSTGFEAKGPTGRPVTGSVCQGFWKGQTIRLD